MQLLAGRINSARRPVAFSAVFLALQLATACSSDSPTVISPEALEPNLAVLDFSGGPVVSTIKSAIAPSMCVNTHNGAFEKGNGVEINSCTGASSQTYEFSSAGTVKVGSSYCLDDFGAKGLPGDRVVIWNCLGATNQKWTTTNAGEIKGLNGLCLALNGGHATNGTTLILSTCTGGNDQKWVTASQSSTPSNPSPTAASVAVSLSTASVAVGETAQASAIVKDASGNPLTGKTVSWTSSSASVASVSAAGLITGLTAGTTNIVGTSEGKSGSASITVIAVSTPTPPTPPAGSCSLVGDLVTHPLSAFAKPGYLQSATEPDFGTTFTRVTGDPGAAIGNGISGSWPTVARLEYAKSQPWSADGRLLVISEMKRAVGPGVQLFLDGDTYKPLFARSHPGPEARWHPTLPDVMIYVAANGSVGHWNARTNASSLKFSTSAYSNALMGPWEGNPSGDGRYLAVTATRASDGKLVVYVVDVDAGTKGPDLDVAAQGFGSASDLDWASVSQGGRYLVLYGTIGGADQLVKVYDRATLGLVGFWKDNAFGHFDLGVDAAGNEVAFGGASTGAYAKRFIMRRLDSGQITPLTPPTTWDWHASTRAGGRPGWGLAVTNDAAGSVFDREIYWVKLDASGTVQRLGRHRTAMSSYDASPFAVPSPDGKRVAFGSNWGGSSVQTFVLDTRGICP